MFLRAAKLPTVILQPATGKDRLLSTLKVIGFTQVRFWNTY